MLDVSVEENNNNDDDDDDDDDDNMSKEKITTQKEILRHIPHFGNLKTISEWPDQQLILNCEYILLMDAYQSVKEPSRYHIKKQRQ